ncbi:MAG TPA: polysaccharide biosynthesis/export family protein [Candidatus Acidoferrum sp.]|nr:polysaccharide biosynthesis/export family protein [Candidatus Acidoferrum sp.]
MRKTFAVRPSVWALIFAGAILLAPASGNAQSSYKPANSRTNDGLETTQDFNRRLEQLRRSASAQAALSPEYRVGSQDVLDVNVFEAPELNRSLRVSANGEIAMPLIGAVQASGLTAREIESSLEAKLRAYVNDPHVGVLVTAVESHPVSVVGAVKQPGVFQIRGPKTVLEMLSMAQGLADDAGDKVLVMRGAGLASASNASGAAGKDVSQDPPAGSDSASAAATATAPSDTNTVEIDLRLLLESADPRYNVPIYPGDIIKVTKAGIVYVVGSVQKAGGFVMPTNEQMSVLKAVALAEGLTGTAAKGHTRIIRTDPVSGKRSEIPINLGKILDGKLPDVPLQAADIVFVPKSGGKAALYRGTDAAIATASGVLIFRP